MKCMFWKKGVCYLRNSRCKLFFKENWLTIEEWPMFEELSEECKTMITASNLPKRKKAKAMNKIENRVVQIRANLI